MLPAERETALGTRKIMVLATDCKSNQYVTVNLTNSENSMFDERFHFDTLESHTTITGLESIEESAGPSLVKSTTLLSWKPESLVKSTTTEPPKNKYTHNS